MRSLSSSLLAVVAWLLLAGATGPAHSQAPSGFAVVAHPSLEANDLSVTELRRIYTGEVSTFSDICIQRRIGDAFFRAVTGQSASAIGRRWVRLLLSGRVAQGPVSLRTDDEVVAYVRAHPGAIGFVSSPSAVHAPGVKRIPVRGEAADAAGYIPPPADPTGTLPPPCAPSPSKSSRARSS